MTLGAHEPINCVPYTITGWTVLKNDRNVLYNHPGLKGALLARKEVVSVDVNIDCLKFAFLAIDCGQDSVECVRGLVGASLDSVDSYGSG